jgi:hypothetical protein
VPGHKLQTEEGEEAQCTTDTRTHIMKGCQLCKQQQQEEAEGLAVNLRMSCAVNMTCIPNKETIHVWTVGKLLGADQCRTTEQKYQQKTRAW